MRKVYSILCALVVSVIAFQAAAQVTVVIDRPEAIESFNYDAEVITPQANFTLPLPTADDWNATRYVSFYMNDGFFVKSIVKYLNGEETEYELYRPTAGNFQVTDKDNGAVFRITTLTDEEFYDASFTLKSDHPELVSVNFNGTYRSVQPSEAAQVIQFNTQYEGESVTLSARDWESKLYKATINGESCSTNWNGDFVIYGLNDGDVVEVTAEWPDIKCPVHFVFTNPDTEGIVTGVTVNDRPVDDWSNLEVQVGSQIAFTLDQNRYTLVDGMFKFNGELTYYSAWSSWSINDETTIEIDAIKLETKEMTFNVQGADKVTLYVGSIYDDSIVPLNEGENKVEFVDSEAFYFTIAAANNNVYIESVSASDPAAIEFNGRYYQVYPVENLVVNVVAKEKVIDQTAVIFVQNFERCFDSSAEFPMYGMGIQGYDEYEIPVKTGYNLAHFAAGSNPFMMIVYNGNPCDYDYINDTYNLTENTFFYINDVQAEISYRGGATWEFNLQDGDVLKLFTDQKPEFLDVTFEAAPGTVNAPAVKRDIIVDVDPANPFKCLPLTLVELSSTDSCILDKVLANGNEIEPAEGVYHITIDADTVITYQEKETGVSALGADNQPVEYFNLQGIRIDNPAQGQIVIRRQGSDAKTVIVK